MNIQSLAQAQTNPAPATTMLKLLLPVDATERSRWSIQYALRRRQSGRPVAATLLLVAEPVTDWQILRFYTQEQLRRFHAQRAQHILEEAALPLQQTNISVQLKFLEGDIAFEILDLAEQLDCDEIVLPLPHSRWAKLFSTDIVRRVLERQRGIPVVTVDAQGEPRPAAKATYLMLL